MAHPTPQLGHTKLPVESDRDFGQGSLQPTLSQTLDMDRAEPALNSSKCPSSSFAPRREAAAQGSLPRKTWSGTRHKFHLDSPCQGLQSPVGSIHFSCSQTKTPSL